MAPAPDPAHRPAVALLGGTGKLGRALTRRLVLAGYSVVIGTRSVDMATRSCVDINMTLGRTAVRFDTYAAAAAAAGIVILCVPYAAQRTIAEEVRSGLNGKILIDTTVPLRGVKAKVVYGADQSAVASLQTLLGDCVKVIAAFQNVPSHLLDSPAPHLDCDVLVCGDDDAARETVVQLIADIGLRGIHAGPIGNALVAEGLTAMLIWINARYKTRGATIKVVLPGQPSP